MDWKKRNISSRNWTVSTCELLEGDLVREEKDGGEAPPLHGEKKGGGKICRSRFIKREFPHLFRNKGKGLPP